MNFFFTSERYSTFSKLYSQSILVNFFGKTRSQFIVNFHCGTNNLISFLLVS